MLHVTNLYLHVTIKHTYMNQSRQIETTYSISTFPTGEAECGTLAGSTTHKIYMVSSHFNPRKAIPQMMTHVVTCKSEP